VAQQFLVLRNVALLTLLGMMIYTRRWLVSYHVLLLVVSLSVLQG
jgi:hypothetical protein